MAYLFLGNLCFSSDERCVTLQLGDCAIITWRGAGLVGKLEGGGGIGENALREKGGWI